MTADDFREIALAMPGATERSHMGHPDFRAGGRIFCSLRTDEAWGAVKLSPDEQREFTRIAPATFVPASGAWGRQGWTSVRLDLAEPAAVRGAVTLAWQHIVDKAPRRRAAQRRAR